MTAVDFTTWPNFDEMVDSPHPLLIASSFREIYHAVGDSNFSLHLSEKFPRGRGYG